MAECSAAHHNKAATARSIPCPSGKHEVTLSNQKTQSGYTTVRWGVVGRQKNTGSVTEITKQKGGLVAEGKPGLFP